MSRNILIRLSVVGLFIVLAVISLVPTLAQKDPATGEAILPDWWKKIKALPQKRINLGLDLRGGVYLVYTARLDEAVVIEGHKIVDSLDNEDNRSKGITVKDSQVTPDGKVTVVFADTKSFQEGGKSAKEAFGADWDIRVDDNNPLALVFQIKQKSLRKYRDDAIQQVRRTVASRVDKWGLAEAGVQIKPPDQLIVELPGIEDTSRIDKVINAQANLELKLVMASGASEEAILQEKGGSVGRYSEIVPYKDAATGLVQEYLMMKKQPDITGDCIQGARQGFGGDFGGQAVVYFNLKGGDNCAGKFARLTGSNIGNRLAIVLDGDVMSAPVIRARIRDSGVIEGNFSIDSANDLAVVLKSGSLSVPVVKDRVERVGPSLGQDNIRRGKWACLISGLFVVLFMIVYYRFTGFLADIALVLNVLFILAAMSTFGATLTLPGFAGIVLTIGMAVDANVLINERIREELRLGKTPKTSVELGYSRALSAILDSNITTFITSAILYFNGTGSIKGFAVTMMYGLVFSVFTAVYVTRVLIDWRLETAPQTELSV